MNTIKRLERLANKTNGKTAHVHIEDGRAYATDGVRMYSTPTDRPDCAAGCEFPNVQDAKAATANLLAMVDVSLIHIRKAVKTAATIYHGRTTQDKRESAGCRWVALEANGNLDVSAASEFGNTTTTLEHGATWNERWLKSKKAYRTSEVTYRKAGEDVTAHYEAAKLADALMLAQDVKAERVDLLFWQHATDTIGVTVRAGDVEALLCGALDPGKST